MNGFSIFALWMCVYVAVISFLVWIFPVTNDQTWTVRVGNSNTVQVGPGESVTCVWETDKYVCRKG